ncbi:hypothetical protein NNJEOMEG_01147 [Fundidesulfovibrio magnetotacticus]|uniref:Outer membrane protein n=1 Tax=Fundidesulfovibrio magnetotacticus TaxID=2730080 RepID=A0A6V8LYH0_9BACT|nr:OmpH family outer membrane protein [Fundidesulfovibrio magnetotacticus]GFK93315.1 hypothetical protein NNJEOMEG_01147 [Fundidesulfovibrio magnetotacticus]
MLHPIKSLLLAVALIAMPLLAHAADKIGVVDSQEVLANSETGKRAMNELKAKFDAKQKELSRQGEEIKKAQDEFNKKAGVMSADAKQKEQAALEARMRKFIEDQNSASQMMDQERNRILEPLMKVFDQVIADYSKKQGYSMVIERRALLYTASGADITADITKEFEAAAKRAK